MKYNWKLYALVISWSIFVLFFLGVGFYKLFNSLGISIFYISIIIISLSIVYSIVDKPEKYAKGRSNES